MDVAASLPVVRVPVLSKAAVPQCASASRTTVPVTRMPLQLQIYSLLNPQLQCTNFDIQRAMRGAR